MTAPDALAEFASAFEERMMDGGHTVVRTKGRRIVLALVEVAKAARRLLLASEISESDCAYDQGEQELANAAMHETLDALSAALKEQP